jgi:hypothetical protein
MRRSGIAGLAETQASPQASPTNRLDARMTSAGFTRSLLIGAGAALVAVGAITGCSPTTEKDAPATSSTTPPSTPPSSSPSSAPAVSPTEKAIGGDNSFSPSINPTGPGAVCKEIVNGVCVR